jgi:tetratricopeptide (TPR) repeat protein
MTRTIMLLMAALLISGCGKKAKVAGPDDAPPVSREDAAFSALFDAARTKYREGDTDGAIDILTEGLANPQWADNHTTIFRSLLELLLQEDRVSDAQTHYMTMLHASPETASQTFSMIPEHLKRQADGTNYLAWAEQMIHSDLPSNILERSYGYYVDANVQAGNDEALPSLAETAAQQFGGAAAVRILARPLNALIDQENYDAVSGVLVKLAAAGDPTATDFVTSTGMTLYAAKGQWASVVSTFVATAATLPDSGSRLALRTLTVRALAAREGAVVDQLCAHVLQAMPTASATRKQAVASYMEVATKAAPFDDAVVRLQQLKAWGVDSGQIGARMSSVFYDVMNHGTDASKSAVMTLAEWAMAESGEERTAHYQSLLMDGAVVCNDYARAMKVLKAGFRADDAAWHSMAVNKVGAHLALQEGRTDDAVKAFRKFMKHVETWGASTVDPTTGIAHSREMGLGFNAKRIAGILADAGRADEATTVYAEARAYFDTAMAAVEADSKEAAYIKGELAGIPVQAPVTAP